MHLGRMLVVIIVVVACGGDPEPGDTIPGSDAAAPPEVVGSPLTCQDGIHVLSKTGSPASVVVEGHPEENLEVAWPAIDEAVRAAIDSYALVGVAVAVVKDCQVLYVKGYGHEDREADVPVLGRKTMFRWASMSKSLTGVVGVQAAAEQRLDLDAPIQSYYASYTPPTTWYDGQAEQPIPELERVVTMRMLLAHLGGIMHYDNGVGSPEPAADINDPKVNTGIEWAMAYFVNKPLVAIPGSEYQYTTFGYNLAGVVLEEAMGMSFAQQVAERIAMPAGMATLQPDYEWVNIPHRAVGYDTDGSRQGSEDVSWKLPGGGFISSTEDLARFCAGLMGDTLLTPSEKAVAWEPQTTTLGVETAYGLGFDIWYRDDRLYVQHAGFQEKTSTRYRYYPEDGLCIVVMSNSAQADTYELVRGIDDVVRMDLESHRR